MLEKLKTEVKELKLLLRSVPFPTAVMLVVAVITMNLLANKSISLPVGWLALDCGIIVSWLAFLAMDVLTKHFGPKAATELSLLAAGINLFVCAIFFAASKIPGVWGESFLPGSEDVINHALDATIGGTWYVLLGSTVAFVISAFVNNFANFAIGRLFKKDNFLAFACRTYFSTAVGQFVDNIVFAFIVSHVFFGWTALQCVTCAVTGMAAELLCEAVFSHLGYIICKRWRRDGVGREYLLMRRELAERT